MPDIQHCITQAEAALDRDDPQAVLQILSPFFQSGMTARAMWLVGRVCARQNNVDQALQCYRAAFQADPSLPFLEIQMDGVLMRMADVAGSTSHIIFADELSKDIYGLKDMDLKPGDTFVDIGANVGFVSIFVAKRFPGVRVIAVEPVPATFAVLEANLKANGVETVTTVNRAVNADGRDLELVYLPNASGGANAFVTDAIKQRAEQTGASIITAPGTTLDDVFHDFQIDQCAALKLDCEGAEYEILRTTRMLERITRIDLELHIDGADFTTNPDGVRDAFIAEITGRVANPPAMTVASLVGVNQT